jgi:hypothetical protein
MDLRNVGRKFSILLSFTKRNVALVVAPCRADFIVAEIGAR